MLRTLLLVFALVSVNSELDGNDEGFCDGSCIWGPILEDWTTQNATRSSRDGRVMQLPASIPNSYITEETRPSKVVNTNGQQQKPGRPISEADLYLLTAIEKLVFRMDFMEKRLKKVEEMIHYVMAGNRIDKEPCEDNFVSIGTSCYMFASMAGREKDWKAANAFCRQNKAVLAELESIEENQDIIAYIQSSHMLKGKDFWTGGLNPGLLWIWSNSARPVQSDKSHDKGSNSIPVSGDGRCLRLTYNPGLRNYYYRGTDCSARYHYICEMPDNSSANQVKRLGYAQPPTRPILRH